MPSFNRILFLGLVLVGLVSACKKDNPSDDDDDDNGGGGGGPTTHFTVATAEKLGGTWNVYGGTDISGKLSCVMDEIVYYNGAWALRTPGTNGWQGNVDVVVSDGAGSFVKTHTDLNSNTAGLAVGGDGKLYHAHSREFDKIYISRYSGTATDWEELDTVAASYALFDLFELNGDLFLMIVDLSGGYSIKKRTDDTWADVITSQTYTINGNLNGLKTMRWDNADHVVFSTGYNSGSIYKTDFNEFDGTSLRLVFTESLTQYQGGGIFLWAKNQYYITTLTDNRSSLYKVDNGHKGEFVDSSKTGNYWLGGFSDGENIYLHSYVENLPYPVGQQLLKYDGTHWKSFPMEKDAEPGLAMLTDFSTQFGIQGIYAKNGKTHLFCTNVYAQGAGALTKCFYLVYNGE